MTSSKSKRAAKSESPAELRHARSHDYAHLVKRWRAAASNAGLALEVFAKSDGYSLLHLFSKKPPADVLSVYFSAGIHGDEPASTEAVLEWIERNPNLARRLNLRIFPCLNPWGLVHNKRTDAEGRDLNRCYRDCSLPAIAAHRKLVEKSRYDLALILHEDYDAQGAYLYETSLAIPHWGERIIAAMARHIPPDPRSRIDTGRAKGGIIRRRITASTMPDWPEAFLLHFHGATRVFTIETASEFDIDTRVEAHVAAIDAAIALIN
jgi:protein MpaA